MKPFTACKLSVPCNRIRMTLLLEVKLSVVIHWITKQNGKAIRVRNWSNSVIALVFGLFYKVTKKVLNYAIPWRIGLRGAAQLFIFTYALVWYSLCIYIHLNNDKWQMTIRKIENARQEECDYINYTIYVSLFSNDRTHKVNCHLSFVITKLCLSFCE